MIPEKKPLLFLKKDLSVTPVDYTVHIATKTGGELKIKNVKDGITPSGGAPSDPKEHAVSVTLTDDTGNNATLLENSHVFNPSGSQSFVKVYIVDDSSAGGGATTGSSAVDFDDAE